MLTCKLFSLACLRKACVWSNFHTDQQIGVYIVQKLIGSPDDASLGFLRSENARRYVRQLPQYPKQQFSTRFPNSSPGAVDLLERMLVFDPSKRITGSVILLYSLNIFLHIEITRWREI